MEDARKLRRSIYITLSFIAIIWMVKIVETTYEIDLGEFGILPRTLAGTIGIVTAPLIHGDIYHLISNSFPLLILGVTFFYFYDRVANLVLLLIYLMTGFWVWIAAREGYYHIGASGVVYGLLSFLLCSGFLRGDRRSLSISFIILFLYGSTFFLGLIPGDTRVSWESHLMGAIAGIFCAVYFKGVIPLPEAEAAIESIEAPEDAPVNFEYHFKEKKSSVKEIKYTIYYTPEPPAEE
jgi:membrane associated rhomboid family serine protease